ncbi:hypothetical protein Tco_1014612 [Tanacetum coccineum]
MIQSSLWTEDKILAGNLANETCKEVQLQLTATINAETGTNNTKMGTKRDWEKIHPNTNNSIKKIDKSKEDKEKKRLQNINNMVLHNVIEIEDSEQQQNVEPTKKQRTTIEMSDDEDTVDSSFGLKAEGRRTVEEYLLIDFFIIDFGSEVQSRQKILSQVLCSAAPKGYKLQEEEVWPQQPTKANLRETNNITTRRAELISYSPGI